LSPPPSGFCKDQKSLEEDNHYGLEKGGLPLLSPLMAWDDSRTISSAEKPLNPLDSHAKIITVKRRKGGVPYCGKSKGEVSMWVFNPQNFRPHVPSLIIIIIHPHHHTCIEAM